MSAAIKGFFLKKRGRATAMWDLFRGGGEKPAAYVW